MYLPLRCGDHITDEDGLVHIVTTVNRVLMSPTTREVLSNAYSIACRSSHQCSLVGLDEEDTSCPRITAQSLTCLGCLAAE